MIELNENNIALLLGCLCLFSEKYRVIGVFCAICVVGGLLLKAGTELFHYLF